ncbi:MAG: AIR carboxylase family protein [Gemmatimonadota bacterium]
MDGVADRPVVPKILILIGSESDGPKMEGALDVLRSGGVEGELIVSSAHRDPARTGRLAARARDEGFSAIICGAGLSAALPGFVAAHTDLPVIGVPISAGTLGGLDALLSTVQMPTGVPVATVGIDNSRNAGHLVLRILRMAGLCE